MTFLENLHFIRPVWLLLAPFAVGIWWLVRRTQDPLRGWRAVMDAKLLQALTVGSDRRSQLSEIGLLVGWLVAVIAIAGPTWRPEPSPFADDPVSMMIVLHAGETMNQVDLVPSRMERARLKVVDIASERKGQPLGLIAYAGSAHLVLPPTRDTSVVATMAEEIGPEIMPQKGDDLSAALNLAERTLGEEGGAIVVITDSIATNALAGRREESQVAIQVLAIGREGSSELDQIRQATKTLRASVTLLSSGNEDVSSLVRRAASVPVAISSAGESARWAESGRWLVPVLALLSLCGFRRVRSVTQEAPIE